MTFSVQGKDSVGILISLLEETDDSNLNIRSRDLNHHLSEDVLRISKFVSSRTREYVSSPNILQDPNGLPLTL